MALISPELLAILVCPEDRRPLRLADEPLVASLNQAIARRQLHNRGGDLLETPLDGGLVREDGSLLYPIVDGIPVLLVDEAILIGQSQPGSPTGGSTTPGNGAPDK